MCKLSVITINYNNAAGLRRTIESVLQQAGVDFEHIVIDGGSNDGSVEVIEQHASGFSYWVSEKDTGIYNAMNKGIRNAKGEYLFFLNSGDTFHTHFRLSEIIKYLSDTDIVYGNILIVEPGKQWVKLYNETIDVEYFTRDTLPHQGSFIKKELFTRVGLYDETLKIAADWKFFLQAICIFNASFVYVNKTISDYDYTGISANPEFYSLQAEEKRNVMTNLFPFFIRTIEEVHELRKNKNFYDAFQKDFFVQKYFGLKLKIRRLLKNKEKN